LEPPGHEEERKTKEDLEDVKEAQIEGRTWREVKRLAADRSRWKIFVEALCSYTGDKRK
jgi:hypothetical protein